MSGGIGAVVPSLSLLSVLVGYGTRRVRARPTLDVILVPAEHLDHLDIRSVGPAA